MSVVASADLPDPGAAAGSLEADEAELAALAAELDPAAGDEGATEVATDEATSGNPYRGIVIRNSFGLREPPAPPPPPQEVAPPVNTSALKLTGITTLLGKRAMFVFNDGKTNQVSDLVREGERDRVITDLEVLEINAAARTVRVMFGGKEMTMDFAKDGLMPPTNQVALAAGGQARPGQFAMAGIGQRPAGAVPQPVVQVVNRSGSGGSRSIPVRPSRLGANLSRPTVQGSGIVASGVGGPGGTDALPTLPTLSPEQQTQLIREQLNFGQQINLEMPPVPPAPGLEDVSAPAFPGLHGEIPQFPAVPGPLPE